MKFGDKLIELRKKNGYSQEELAEKLGVSRQSVSKWESNNTYPETDKIIQIANLFDCSMDDLINDKVTDVESSLRKNKNIYNIWDSLLEFLTKTINMFSHMTFSQGLNCVLELIILSVILLVLGNIICGTASDIIIHIFSFINNDFPKLFLVISTVIEGVFDLIWFILSIIIIIYTFKVRHLNDYEEETIKINEKNENNKESKTTQENRIIRHENEKPYEFLSVLSKIVLYFIKFIAGCILLGTAASAVGFVITSVLLGSFIPTNLLFLWLSLIFVACTAISIIIVILLACFIFNKKVNVKATVIIFIISIVLFGGSIGMSVLQIKNIDFVDDNSAFQLETKELEFDYKDNLVIDSDGVGFNNIEKYIIDNNIPEGHIIISRQIDPRYFNLNSRETTMDKLPVIKISENNKNFRVMYDFFIEHLKDNKIYTFKEYGNDPLVIKANENTINNLKNNLKKLYLVDEKVNGNETDIVIKDDKVFFEDGLDGEYNAIDDSIKYYDDDYICKKEIEQTKYGERIIYICDEKED